MEIKKYFLKDSYMFYRGVIKNTKEPGMVNYYVKYLKIVTGYMKFLADKMADGWQVQLSAGNSLGTFAVVMKKVTVIKDKYTGEVRMPKHSIDWPATRKYHAENPDAKGYIYYTNDNTDGERASIVWWKTGMLISNKWLYSFIPVKGETSFRKKVSKNIRDGKEYISTH